MGTFYPDFKNGIFVSDQISTQTILGSGNFHPNHVEEWVVLF